MVDPDLSQKSFARIKPADSPQEAAVSAERIRSLVRVLPMVDPGLSQNHFDREVRVFEEFPAMILQPMGSWFPVPGRLFPYQVVPKKNRAIR